MNRKYITAGVYALLFALFFCFFLWPMRAVLSGWEAHNVLFRFSADFFGLFGRGKAWGPLLCANSFFTQFYYYPWLGSLVYAAFFTLLSFCIHRLVPSSLFLGFLISALLLPVLPYSGWLVPVMVLAMVVGGLLWRATSTRNPWAVLVRIAVLGGLTFLIKEFVFGAWVLYTLIDLCDTRQSRRQKILNTLLFLLIALLWTILATWLWMPYDFYIKTRLFQPIAPKASQLLGMPMRCFFPHPSAEILLLVGLLLLLLLPLVQKGLQKLGRKALYAVEGLCLAIGCTCLVITPLQSHETATFYKADALCRQQQWNEALQLLDKDYPARSAQKDILSHSNTLYSTQLKTCLLATRKATDRIFTYSLYAFPLLFPENITNHNESYILPPYYLYIGQYSAALHMNYDWVTGQTLNASVLLSLIETSLIVDDTLPASKFVYMLNQSLFRGKDARQLFARQTPEIQRQIKRGKMLLPSLNFSVDAYMPDRTMVKTSLLLPDNPYTYEYLLIYALLEKNKQAVAWQFEQIKQFYPQGIPRHLQEALLATYHYEPARYMYPTSIEGISKETWNEYWAFMVDDQAYQKQALPFADLHKKWKHTYWFYDLYTTIRNN